MKWLNSASLTGRMGVMFCPVVLKKLRSCEILDILLKVKQQIEDFKNITCFRICGPVFLFKFKRGNRYKEEKGQYSSVAIVT